MRKFLYFVSADYLHLQTRLERLAAKGLELVSAEGLFSGEFAETVRNDLRYLVVPYGNQRYFPAHIDPSVYGWTLVGGFNGMAIYKSLPCVDADGEAILSKLQEEGLVHLDRHTLPILFALLFLLGALAGFVRTVVPEWGTQWFMSYAGMILPALSGLCFVLLGLNLLAMRSYLSAWIHGVTIPVLFVVFLSSLALWQLDNRGQNLYFIGFLVLLALAWGLTFWRYHRLLSMAIPAICLVVLCVGLLFPCADVTAVSGSSLRHQLEDAPVVNLTQFGVDDAVTASGYRTEGTFLVCKTTYWEVSEAGTSCSSEVYSCATTALADGLSEQLRSVGTWEPSSDGFVRYGGRTVLLRRGKVLALISCSQPMEDSQLDAIYTHIFG